MQGELAQDVCVTALALLLCNSAFKYSALQLEAVRPGIDGFSGSEMLLRPAREATLVPFVPILQGVVPMSAWWDF